MNSAKVLEIITCRICLESFNENSKCPRMLSCGHSFCHYCLEKLLSQNPSCPTCGAGILFNSIESISINFSLKSLIAISRHFFMRSYSTNLHGEISEPPKSGPEKVIIGTSNSKYLSEGYCDEHDTYKGMKCIDCGVWICGMCGMLHHKNCRTLLVKEAYKEINKHLSQKVEEELGQRMSTTKRLNESLRVMEEERRYLIEELKKKELELKEREHRIKELKSLKAEENFFCDKLKQLQKIVKISENNAEFSRAFKELETMLQEGKRQIPVDLHHPYLPYTRESLGTLCQNRSVYAIEDRYDGPKYGKVEIMKDGQILVASFQSEKPKEATLFTVPFPELLYWFNNKSIDLPKMAFLQVNIHDGSGEDSFKVIIETNGISLRAQNFLFFCSALKGPSYKGEKMFLDCYCYHISSPHPPVVEGINFSSPQTPLISGGVFTLAKSNSCFKIHLKNHPAFSGFEIGVIRAGLHKLKGLQSSQCSIEECGLVI